MKKKFLILLFFTIIIDFSCSSGNYITCDTPNVRMVALDVNINSIKYDSLSNKVFIEGKVFDQKNKDAILGANIILLPNPKLKVNAITDKKGFFKIEFDPSKYESLEISYIGYYKKKMPINKLIQGNQ